MVYKHSQIPPINTLEEARCILNVAHAERDVCLAEKNLADSRVRETLLRAKLYRMQAKLAHRKLMAANLNVGKVLGVIRRSGQSRALKVGTREARPRVQKSNGEFIFSIPIIYRLMSSFYSDMYYVDISSGSRVNQDRIAVNLD